AAGRLRDEVAAPHLPRVGGGRSPFLHDQALAHVQAPGREGDVGPGLEDRADVVAHLGATRRLAGGVVVEDHVRRVHGDDRVEVVRVPGVVVTVDRLTQGRLAVLASIAHPRIESKLMGTGYTIKHRDEFESMEGSGDATWKLARKSLGTSAFGF